MSDSLKEILVPTSLPSSPVKQATSVNELCEQLECEAKKCVFGLMQLVGDAKSSASDSYWNNYYGRLRSFLAQKGRFKVVSPVKCAVYGWILAENSLLRCDDCLQTMEIGELKLEEMDSNENRLNAAKFLRALSEKHSTLCAWRTGHGRPFRSFDIDDRLELIGTMLLPGVELKSSKVAEVIEKSSTGGSAPDSEFYLAAAGWEVENETTVTCRECLKSIDLHSLTSIDPLTWHEVFCPVVDKNNQLWKKVLNQWLMAKTDADNLFAHCSQLCMSQADPEATAIAISERQLNAAEALDTSMRTLEGSDDPTEIRTETSPSQNDLNSSQKVDVDNLNVSNTLTDEAELEAETRKKFAVPPPKRPAAVQQSLKRKPIQYKDEQTVFKETIESDVPTKRQRIAEPVADDFLQAENDLLKSVNSPAIRQPISEQEEHRLLDEDEPAEDEAERDLVEKIPKFPSNPPQTAEILKEGDSEDEDGVEIHLSDSSDDENAEDFDNDEHDSEEGFDSQNDIPEDYPDDLEEEEEMDVADLENYEQGLREEECADRTDSKLGADKVDGDEYGEESGYAHHPGNYGEHRSELATLLASFSNSYDAAYAAGPSQRPQPADADEHAHYDQPTRSDEVEDEDEFDDDVEEEVGYEDEEDFDDEDDDPNQGWEPEPVVTPKPPEAQDDSDDDIIWE